MTRTRPADPRFSGWSDWHRRRTHERAYARAVKRAFGEVPYYRELWAAAGSVCDVPPVPAERLDSLARRLYPLAYPPRSGFGTTTWLGEPRELYDALLLTESYQPASTVFEIRTALLDWARIGPLGRGAYRVILAGDAVVDPFRTTGIDPRRRAVESFLRARQRVLVGRAEQVAAFLDTVAGQPPATTVLAVHTLDELAARPDRDGLLHHPRLGWLGGWSRSCGRAHLNWRRFHARPLAGGLVFTKLSRRPPALVHVQPAAADRLALAPCPRHGTPVLSSTRP